MEKEKKAANGGGSVKKKSFFKKILISKWFFIIVLILGVSGYIKWGEPGRLLDWIKSDRQPHTTHVAHTLSEAHDADHDTLTGSEIATHDTFSEPIGATHGQAMDQPDAQKHDSHDTAQHEAAPLKHTASHTDFNETVHEHKDKVVSHAPAAETAGHAHAAPEAGHGPAKSADDDGHGHGTAHAAPVRTGPRGVAFVQACIKPLDHELNHRFLGWRPNDVIRIADNIKNLQLGVLEVTRRTAVALAENLSRTGSTDAYVPSLEYAMNSFMIKPTEYMFPSAESKYQEGLDEWLNYQNMLEAKEEHFYRRVDNLVPLLKAYESILGSCDENLVKNLGNISTFKADDVFYYTKGVAIAMGTILEAVAVDFDDTIGSVQGMDVLHHTVEALHHASHMDPWIVLEGAPDGILANHRANIAAPISHARFYLDVLSRSLTGNL